MDYSFAKKMYEKYACNEYNMKIEGVLDKYKSFNVPLELQEQWKKEYIIGLCNNFAINNDLSLLNKISSFSRDSTDIEILRYLYNIYNNVKKSSDLNFVAKVCFALINSINVFQIRKAPGYIKIVIDDVFGTIEYIKSKLEEYNDEMYIDVDALMNLKKSLEVYSDAALKIKGRIL